VTYELRISYSPDSTVGGGDVRGRYDCLTAVALEFVTCSAPFKQILARDEGGVVRFLDEQGEEYVEEVARRYGWVVEEVGDDAD
jgi:hypothetical protein